jgi:hypothetical protein
MKKTDLFTKLDNVIGNYMDGSATADEVATVAHKVNQYLFARPHPDDCLVDPKEEAIEKAFKAARATKEVEGGLTDWVFVDHNAYIDYLESKKNED